jgi:(2Fe-2S) ferredoxin
VADVAKLKRFKDSVADFGGSLIGTPVEFTVTASYQEKSYTFETFNAFVSRIIEVSAEDAREIATALVAEDGRHVPTYVYERGGKYFAKINSMTNSTYVLIKNNQSFADADGKWYEAVADEMANRKVLNGVGDGHFEGERNMTRAEFAAMTVRALGLPTATTSDVFSDVPQSAWYAGVVSAGYKYGLFNGRTVGNSDGTEVGAYFDPAAPITRQEALWVLERACQLAKLAVVSGILNDGRYADKLTRAEAATMVLRMLQKSDLVDIRAII